MDDGTLEQTRGGWTLRFERHLAQPPEKVWRALTEPEHLAAWFPADMEGERRAGAPLQFPFRDGEGETMDGEMLVYEPPSVLQYRWDVEILRFELHPTPGGCTLTFTSTLADVGTGARDAAGWHACLDLLSHHLAGATPRWTPDGRWAQLHPGYVERLPAEASTIGPPDRADAQA
jgi:uncharacterized protein YndB with AHSA1/START domain